jgi:hypothetical protein
MAMSEPAVAAAVKILDKAVMLLLVSKADQVLISVMLGAAEEQVLWVVMEMSYQVAMAVMGCQAVLMAH